MIILAKYGTALTFESPIVKRGVVDLAASADWTPASGDCKIVKDGGNVANVTDLPTAVGGTGSVLWRWTLTATEMQAARISYQVVDSATKAVEDQVFVILTYGHASAHIVADLSQTNLAANVAQWSGTNVASPDTAGYPKVTVKSGTGTGEINLASGVADANAVKVSGTAQTAGDIIGRIGSPVLSVSGDLATVAAYVDTVEASLARLLGLSQDNWVMDDTTYDGDGNLTAATIYVYSSKANAVTHDKSTGLSYKWSMSGTITGGVLTQAKQLRET